MFIDVEDNIYNNNKIYRAPNKEGTYYLLYELQIDEGCDSHKKRKVALFDK
eukprot:m.13102 g.13102  ORF g.13102 m.13102 type:complete len:51 (-) comp4108_c0_seq1:1223-1375(-)